MSSIESKFKNEKFKSFFKKITQQEYILICIPFIVSLVSTKGVSYNPYGFIFLAMSLIIGMGIMYLVGIRWRIIYFGILLFFAIFLIFTIGKPWEYALQADRDSAIKVGIEAILNGENPHKAKTSLGSAPTPLPFTYILYLPIYLLTGGYVFYMNIVIISIFSFVLFYKFSDSKRDYLILPIMSFIIFSDYFFLEIGMNSDVINTLLIFSMALFLIPDNIPEQKIKLKFLKLSPEKPKKIDRNILIFAILFGCILAMRTYFWFIGIVVLIYILKIYGVKNTFFLGLISISVFLIWILPFMLQDVHYFIFENPLGHNADKFSIWRLPGSIEPFGNIILDFLNNYLNYGEFNGVIITLLIIFISGILGLIKCENKFHLFLIISICFFIFLFFYFHTYQYLILRDYISIAAVPFTVSFIYVDMEGIKKNITIDEKNINSNENLK